MNRAALVLLLVCCAAGLTEGCSAARKARKARKLEAARRADSTASVQRRADSLFTRNDSMRGTAVTPDTVETPALDPTKASIPRHILTQHGVGRFFRTFSGKAKLEYEGTDQSADVTVVIRIRRDSAIWASVVAVGGAVPVARVLITPDSVFYVNFLRREGARMAAPDAANLLPIPLEFAQLQAVLLGDAQAPRAAITSTGTAEVSDVYYVATRLPHAAYTSYYNAADTTLIGEEALGVNDGSQTTVQYRMFEGVDGKRFPLRRKLTAVVARPDSVARHTVLLTFSDPPRFDVPLDFSFSIPKNYTVK